MFPLKETAFKNRKEASSFETDDWILELLWLERHLVQYMHWQIKKQQLTYICLRSKRPAENNNNSVMTVRR